MQFDPAAAVSNALKGKFIASLAVTEEISKKGNPMFKVTATLNVNGRDRTAWDYIGSWNLYKLKELASVCNIAEKFEAGSIEDIDLDGQVVGVQVAPDKDDEDRISIKHYISQNEVRTEGYSPASIRSSEGQPPQEDDPDVPF